MSYDFDELMDKDDMEAYLDQTTDGELWIGDDTEYPEMDDYIEPFDMLDEDGF